MTPLPLPEWIDFFEAKGKRFACRDCNRVYVREEYAVMHAVGHEHALSTMQELREECERYGLDVNNPARWHEQSSLDARFGHRYLNAVGDVCAWCGLRRNYPGLHGTISD